jgi:hypothetical protein
MEVDNDDPANFNTPHFNVWVGTGRLAVQTIVHAIL